MLSKADHHDDTSINLPELYTEEKEDEVLAFISSEQAKLSMERMNALPDRSTIEWIVGFLDGDGCLRLVKDKTSATVAIGQAHTEDEPPATLQRIHRYYGGSFNKQHGQNGARQKWYLRISQCAGNHTLVRAIANHGVIKAPQAALLIKFFNEGMVNREYTYKRLALLKKRYNEITVDASRLTAAYISGLFDAEGCVMIKVDSHCRLQIAQQSSPPMLRAILCKWPGGTIRSSINIEYCGEAGDDLLADLLQHSLGKADQLQILAQHRQDQKDWRSEHGNKHRTGKVSQVWKAKTARRIAQLKAMKRK